MVEWLPMKQICVQLPDETVDQLQAVAEHARRSRSNLVRLALEEWLKAHATRDLAARTLRSMEDTTNAA